MPPLVTHIEPRRDGFAAVTIQGEEPTLLPLEVLIESGLHEGSRLPEPAWRDIRRTARERVALRRALMLVSRRSRTEAQLTQALAREFEPGEVERAIARLRELRYLDDAAWAQRYVDSSRARQRGRALLWAELRQRGVSSLDADTALAGRDELQAALEAGRRRLPSLLRVDPDRRRRRLYDFLRRRGFEDPTALRALDRLLAEAEQATEPEAPA